MGKGTVVLAYSGGLDTSICIPLLKERYDYNRVVTVAVNVGQRDEEIEVATKKGQKLADRHYTIDVRERFVEEHIFPAIKANGSYEGYPMGTSLARPLIAEEVVKIAKKEKATAVAHGCTGKGNDQLRFDFIIRAAGLDVVAPIREQNLTRDWEIEYAKEHRIPVPVKKEQAMEHGRELLEPEHRRRPARGPGIFTRPRRSTSGQSPRKRPRQNRRRSPSRSPAAFRWL